MRRTGITIAAITSTVALTVGCGGGGGEKKQEKPPIPAEAPANNPPVEPAKSGAPDELLGQYTVTLDESDLPDDAADELTEGGPSWTVTIAETGGPGEGPAFTIANDLEGPLESSNFEVKGDRILVHEQECASTGEPVESVWRYELKGKELTLTEEKGSCPDEVALTVLTTKPLRKKG